MKNKFKFKVGDRVEDSITGKATIVEGYTKDYYCMDWEHSSTVSMEMHKDHVYWTRIKKTPQFKIGDRVKYIGNFWRGSNNKVYTIDSFINDLDDTYIKVKERDGNANIRDFIKKGDKMNYICVDGKKIELSAETVANFKKENLQKDILVPNSIKINEGTTNYSKGILFNDEKQELYYSNRSKVYMVQPANNCNSRVSCKLTPCKREYLESGDLAFRSNYSKHYFDELWQYSLILNAKEYVYVNNNKKDIIVSDCDWDYWYKIEEVNK